MNIYLSVCVFEERYHQIWQCELNVFGVKFPPTFNSRQLKPYLINVMKNIILQYNDVKWPWYEKSNYLSPVNFPKLYSLLAFIIKTKLNDLIAALRSP